MPMIKDGAIFVGERLFAPLIGTYELGKDVWHHPQRYKTLVQVISFLIILISITHMCLKEQAFAKPYYENIPHQWKEFTLAISNNKDAFYGILGGSYFVTAVIIHKYRYHNKLTYESNLSKILITFSNYCGKRI